MALLVATHQFRVLLFQENLHTVVPGEVYRSSQPSPRKLAAWIEQLGLRRVVNLRSASANQPAFEEEARIVAAAGADLKFVRLSARRWPTREELRSVVHMLDTSPRPLLLHCRSGTDRAGLASAVARLLHGDPPERADDQFGWRYGYFEGAAGSHLLEVIRAYDRWLEAQESEHTPDRLREWVADHYAPPE